MRPVRVYKVGGPALEDAELIAALARELRKDDSHGARDGQRRQAQDETDHDPAGGARKRIRAQLRKKNDAHESDPENCRPEREWRSAEREAARHP